MDQARLVEFNLAIQGFDNTQVELKKIGYSSRVHNLGEICVNRPE